MKLLKTLKSLKNLQKSKLAKAVAMSLIVGSGVMGVCGSAWAATVTIENKEVTENVYGKNREDYNLKQDAANASVDIINATVNGNVIGGSSCRGAFFNTVSLKDRSIVTGDVVGGVSVGKFEVYGNTVNLNSQSTVKGNVIGGKTGFIYGQAWGYYTHAEKNTVNVDGSVTVQKTVYGGIGNIVENNTLNVQGINNRFGGIDGFQNINFKIFANRENSFVPIDLTVNDAIDWNKISFINADIDRYDPGATVTLLQSPNSDFTKLSKDKLKINGGSAVEIAIDKNRMYDGDYKKTDAISAVAGFDISKNALNFTTKLKLDREFKVDESSILGYELKLNKQTINMQQPKDAAAGDVRYDLLRVKKLTGEGNLAIDVDFADGTKSIQNDKIYIMGNEPNDAIINLSSVIVRRDLPSTLTGIQEEKGEISVIEGNLNGITLNVDRNAHKVATSKYIYVFTPGEEGKLKFTQMLPGTISEFIQAQGKYKTVGTLTLTEDEVADKNLGWLQSRLPNKNYNITLNFNEGISLSGKNNNKNYKGVEVDDYWYTFNLIGENGKNPGKMTDFQKYAVRNEGTLNVKNMKFEGNDKDIINNGTLNLYGGNTITSVAGTGTTSIEEGHFNMPESFEQGNVNVKKDASLTYNAKAKVSGTINNDGTLNLYGNPTLPSVSGKGRINVNTGTTTVSGKFEQGYAFVDTYKTLTLNGVENNIDKLKVSFGYVRLTNANGINKIRTVDNSGKFYLNGTTTIESINRGEPDYNLYATTIIQGGESTVTGDFRDGTLTIDAGKLTLKGSGFVKNALNIKSKGTLEIGGILTHSCTHPWGEVFAAGINNDGIVIMNSSKDNTLNSVTGNGTFNVAQGKTTVTGAFAQKTVNVSGGELELKAPKDSFINGDVQWHAANITGGKVTGHVYGGLSVEDAHENNVNITNGTVEGDVYGGASYNGNAYNNTVKISGGNITGDVYGALTINNGTAYKNTVEITGGKIEGNVYGGINNYGTNSTHHNNVINISGGEVVGTIFGASDKVEANNLLKVTGSNVNVGNIAYLQQLDFTLPAGYKNSDYKNALLVLTNKTDTDKNIEAQKTSLNFKGEGSIVVSSAPEERLTKDDVVTLIHKTNDKALEINENGKFIFDTDGVLTKEYQKTALYFATPFYMLKGNLQLVDLDNDNIRNDLLFQIGNHISADDEKNPKPIVPIDSQDDPVPEPDPEPQPQPKPEPKPEPIVPVDPKPEKPVYPDTPDDPDDKPQPQPKPITPVDPEPQPEPTPDPKPDPTPDPDPDPQPDPTPDPKPDPTPDPDPDPKPDPTPTPKPVAPEPQPTPEPDPQPQPIDYDKVYGEFLDNVKTAMETRANGAALLNEAGDFLMKQGLSNAKMAAEQSKAEGDSSMAPFVALGGGKLRYETGSHVDSKSWHGAVGLAKQVKGLTFGVAIQQGKSNYDAYVNKAHSEGTSKSVGGALFAEKKTASGLHFDAAVRGGRIKNDYNANVSYSFEEVEIYNVHYKESSAFYGVSFGGGKKFTLKTKDKVDVYGRYAWTHTGSSEATTNWKDELKFDGINSHRILLGGRYTHAVNERNELYAGLGWQYELGGKVKGSIYGYSAPEPSLKGSSGLLELGWKAAAEENMTVDLNLSGWTGKQRGVMAGVNMQWKF